jgi:hypothetical protein
LVFWLYSFISENVYRSKRERETFSESLKNSVRIFQSQFSRDINGNPRGEKNHGGWEDKFSLKIIKSSTTMIGSWLVVYVLFGLFDYRFFFFLFHLSFIHIEFPFLSFKIKFGIYIQNQNKLKKSLDYRIQTFLII